MFRSIFLATLLASVPHFALAGSHSSATADPQLGPRPFFLVDRMDDGPLKDKLASCTGPFQVSDWSIGHRGAPLQFPEHTVESYKAAALQGAGIIECDVTFTKDRQLVCRHAQNDLATTTNILGTDLASSCVVPFTAAAGEENAKAQCRTSELTLDQFLQLRGKMDASNAKASTPEEFMDGTANFRTDLYSESGTLMTHKAYIELVKGLGRKFTPELKSASVDMPFDGDFTQAAYAQAMIDEYKQAGVSPADVWVQSFNLDDIKYWIANEPEFGKQAVYLDDRYEAFDDDEGEINSNDPATFKPTMKELADMGVKYIAPPMWMLVTLENGAIVPSAYAREAKAAGLNIISWTAERSGLISNGGGWYFQSVKDAINNDGDVFALMDVLAKDVGIAGLFSDWPATTTFYANCTGLK